MNIQNINRCWSVAELFITFLEQLRVRSDHIPGQPGALDGDMTIEALPTWYGGTTFRSALEAGWAATLDSLNIAWEYEPETITLPSGAKYIPDFRLPELGTWIEVKGTGVPRIEKAIEFGETLACHCEGTCTCEWPGGQIVLIGHPPKPYDPWRDPELEGQPYRILNRAARRHGGHPLWSTTSGSTAWLVRCRDCYQAGWFTFARCRACRGRLAGAHAYSSGDAELQFVRVSCQPSPAGDAS